VVKYFIFSLILAMSACAPSTPQSRIEKFPEKFATLNKKEQALVQQGQIAPGMSKDGVLLAWGFPDQRFEGARDSKVTERWDYATTMPVYSTPLFVGPYGGRYGRYWRQGYYDLGYAAVPEIAYIPFRVASVWFVDHKVDAWERVR
jgi:hypothetical protein